ncbi:hypothetical protein [Accumulibacter sp.]|uniref:hypothetical protein n=1 Tax=Accumulibacter sp. TaxID=2053492 RepID=UPI0025F35074|nr:hypothetical protein [Accumulibacter sp.]MCP5228551.1 hypothetical protein [Accumulibacter sp.]
MNTFNIKAVAIAISMTFSAGAMAEAISKSEYKAGKDKIAIESGNTISTKEVSP